MSVRTCHSAHCDQTRPCTRVKSGGFVRAESIGQNRVSMIAHVVREWWAWSRCNFVLLVNVTYSARAAVLIILRGRARYCCRRYPALPHLAGNLL